MSDSNATLAAPTDVTPPGNSEWKPIRWWATVLTLFANPCGLLYVQRARLAMLYAAAGIVACLSLYVFPKTRVAFDGEIVPVAALLVAIVATVHTFIIATGYPATTHRKWYSRWYGLIGISFTWFALGYSVRAFVVEPMHVASSSMYPSMPKNTFVLISKWGSGSYSLPWLPTIHSTSKFEINRGDVVLFRRDMPAARSLLRVIGLPGEHIEYKDHHLRIDGRDVPMTLTQVVDGYQLADERLDSQVVHIALMPERSAMDLDIVVPQGHYVLMGDSRDNTLDSRYIGPVPRDRIRGKLAKIIR